MEMTIDNLLPATEYEFMVLSQDRFGDGMFSKSYKFFTSGMYDFFAQIDFIMRLY